MTGMNGGIICYRHSKRHGDILVGVNHLGMHGMMEVPNFIPGKTFIAGKMLQNLKKMLQQAYVLDLKVGTEMCF